MGNILLVFGIIILIVAVISPMNKKNIYICMIAIGLFAIFMSGCVVISKPAKKKMAIDEVSKALGYEPQFTNYYVEKSSYKWNRNNYYYEFEDAQGMRFSFSSELKPQGIDGATFYYSYENKVNYKRRILPFYCKTIEELCNKYNLGFERTIKFSPKSSLTYDVFGNEEQYSASCILIDGYKDLDTAANLIAEILNECRIYSLSSELFDSDKSNTGLIVRTPTTDGDYTNIANFQLINPDKDVNCEEIYNELFKAYIEKIKTDRVLNDVPGDALSSTCPKLLHGVYQDKYYDLWVAVLVSDEDPEHPEYSFEIEYREPKDREDYKYVEAYYSKDFRIYDIIAQLGGECNFHEKIKGRKCPGFEGYLGDDTYQFGFENISMDTIYIARNGKEYLFKTKVINPANNTYSFIINKETFEELFSVKITYNFAESIFLIE